MTQPTQALQASQTSNWPYVYKAVLWMDKEQTAMKVVKYIASVIILPLAFLMDLISKAVNYVWPQRKVEVQGPLTWKEWAKEKAQAGWNGACSVWTNHKGKILAGGGIALAAIGSYYLVPSLLVGTRLGTWCCNQANLFCQANAEAGGKGPTPPSAGGQ